VTPTRAGSALVALAALAVIILVVRGLLTPGAPPVPQMRVATVTRGTVLTVATETGTLVPVTQQNVNFRQSGQLTEVDVKVGEHVTAGQLLAKIDPRSLQDALQQAVQRTNQDQASLNATLTGNAVQTAQHNVQASQTALGNAIAQATLTNQQDAVTVAQDQAILGRDAGVLAKDQAVLDRDAAALDRAQAQLAGDVNQLQKDEAVLAADQAQLARDQGRVSVDQTRLAQDQAKAQADCPAGASTSGASATPTPSPSPSPSPSSSPSPTTSAQCAADRSRVQSDESQLTSDERQVATDQKAVALDQAPVSQDQARVQADQAELTIVGPLAVADKQLVSGDGTKVEQDQTTLRADLQKQAADQVAGRTAVNNAQANLTAAQDALIAQTNMRPNTIAGQQAVVASDQAAADTALQNVQETVLTAPVDGTVASVTGTVGEPVTAGGGETPEAPGSNAPQPDTGAATTQTLLGGSSPATGTATPAFLTLTDVHSFQVVALVSEADAARIMPNQDVRVTTDAVPGLILTGEVLAVGPNATLVENVTNYQVTIGLDRIDPRLRSGMNVRAGVAVGQVPNVLAVPNDAVHRSGSETYVLVITPEGTQERRQITTGVVGDTTTQVTSGLGEGDHVLLPLVPPPGGPPGAALS
jgi:HlyD family secretion protein